MKFSTLITIVAPLLVAASSPEDTDSIEGYNTVIPEWEIEVSPGGPVVTLNGTIEEVHAELLGLNPNWDAQYLSDEEPASLAKRTDFTGSNWNCFGRWSMCSTLTIQRGVRYLRGVSGKPKNGPGPANCGRVSCSDNAGIWWCNDARATKELASFGSIADGADFILKRCQLKANYDVSGYTAGQVFHKTNWNVIIQSAKC